MNDSEWSDESGHRADPERIISRIHREEARAGYHAFGDRDRTLKWDEPDDREMVRSKFASTDGEAIVPGFGPEGRAENAREDCGNPHPFVCPDCGHSVEFGRTCSQSVCARCGVAWVRDAAIQKTAKLRRIRKEKHQHTPDREHQKFHHQVISPSLGFFYALARDGYSLSEALEKAREIVKDILDEMRGQGLVLCHSFRGENDDGSVADDELVDDDDRGLWKQLLNSDRKWLGDVRGELAWMPHFHCVIVADWQEGGEFTKRIEDETGWVIARIADDDGVSVPDDGAMAALTTYSLSHTDIYVNDEGNNQSGAWWVGSFDGDIIKSSGRFSARPHDLDWADAKVRDAARLVLGLNSGTTDCGADLPAVDDPDALARSILEELYPDDEPRVPTDVVLEHVRRGNISVDVSSTSGGGGAVTVTDAFGHSAGGWGSPGDLPDVPTGTATADGGEEAVRTIVDDDQKGDDCGCGHDHDDEDDDDTCDGTLVPLEVARSRGLLDDEDWVREALFADEAQETDEEWPDDMDPWRTESPGAAIGAG